MFGKHSFALSAALICFLAGFFFVLPALAFTGEDPLPIYEQTVQSAGPDITFQLTCSSGGGILGGGQTRCYSNGSPAGQVWRWVAGPAAADPSLGQIATVDVCINNSGYHGAPGSYCWSVPYWRDSEGRIPRDDFNQYKWLSALVVVNGDSLNAHWHSHSFTAYGRETYGPSISANPSSVSSGDDVEIRWSATNTYRSLVEIENANGDSFNFDDAGHNVDGAYDGSKNFTARGSGTARAKVTVWGVDRNSVRKTFESDVIEISVSGENSPGNPSPPSGTPSGLIRATVNNYDSDPRPDVVIDVNNVINVTEAEINRNELDWA
ncbi:MAG: hypothetical protein V1856_02470, partial [Candidatus Liptonbacteria bacterium]